MWVLCKNKCSYLLIHVSSFKIYLILILCVCLYIVIAETRRGYQKNMLAKTDLNEDKDVTLLGMAE